MSETGDNIFNRAKKVREELENKDVYEQDSIINADENTKETEPKKEIDPIIIADGKTDLEKRTEETNKEMDNSKKDGDDIIVA